MIIFFINNRKGGEAVKAKALDFFAKSKYELVMLAVLCIQALINIDMSYGMAHGFLVYYLADFSMGKTSRLIIGSIVNLLTDNPTLEWINCFAAILLLLIFILTAVLVGKVIKSTDPELQVCVFVISLFFVTGEFSVSTFSKFFGICDVYMYLATVISLVIVQKKMFRWFIPLLCIGGVLINYVYPISYFLPVGLVLLYLVCTQEKKAGNIIILTVSVISVIVLMLYCVFIGNKTATVTFDEMWQIMEQKSDMELEYSAIRYYDYYLFGNNDEGEALMNIEINEANPFEFIYKYLMYMVKHEWNIRIITMLIVATLPMLVLFSMVWIKCIKKSEKKSRKFAYACFMLSNIGMFLCYVTSTDITRWAAAGIINQFLLSLFMFAVKDEPFMSVMSEAKTFLKGKGVFVAIIYIIYAFSAKFSLSV